MKILIIDNYDSFTYNLAQLIGHFTADITVARNDKISLGGILDLNPDKIVISPGPGNPSESGISLDVIKSLGNQFQILGVCLGHQAIGQCFGARIIKAPVLMHGKTSAVIHDGKRIYADLSQNFIAGRYHSLIIEKESIPAELIITAETEDGIVMGVRHKEYTIEGIQFHPESILTKTGHLLIDNWIRL